MRLVISAFLSAHLFWMTNSFKAMSRWNPTKTLFEFKTDRNVESQDKLNQTKPKKKKNLSLESKISSLSKRSNGIFFVLHSKKYLVLILNLLLCWFLLWICHPHSAWWLNGTDQQLMWSQPSENISPWSGGQLHKPSKIILTLFPETEAVTWRWSQRVRVGTAISSLLHTSNRGCLHTICIQHLRHAMRWHGRDFSD